VYTSGSADGSKVFSTTGQIFVGYSCVVSIFCMDVYLCTRREQDSVDTPAVRTIYGTNSARKFFLARQTNLLICTRTMTRTRSTKANAKGGAGQCREIPRDIYDGSPPVTSSFLDSDRWGQKDRWGGGGFLLARATNISRRCSLRLVLGEHLPY